MAQHRPVSVLVTGGAGFVGSHLVERLVARGDDVTVVDTAAPSERDNLAAVASHIDRHHGDCEQAASLIATRTFETVFHLGAPAYVPPSVDDPVGDLRANVEQTLVLLQALRAKPARLVHVSSAAVYGEPSVAAIAEDMPPAPVSPYGVDKFAAEEHVRVAALLHQIPAVILRYFPVFGPRQRKQVVYDVTRKMLTDGDRVEVFGDGTERRDLVFVDDVVSATLVAARAASAKGEAYNVGTGEQVTIASVVDEIARALGVSPEIAWSGSVRAGDSVAMVADISRIRSLGYEPRVGFADGIERTVRWIEASA